MLRKKKKIYKILSVLVAVIIAFSLFSIPASAATTTVNFGDFWTLNPDGCGLWYAKSTEEWTDITSDVAFNTVADGSIFAVRLYPSENWGADNFVRMTLSFDINGDYVNYGYSSLSFRVNEWNEQAYLVTSSSPYYSQTFSSRMSVYDSGGMVTQVSNKSIADNSVSFSFPEYFTQENYPFTRVAVNICFRLNDALIGSSGSTIYVEMDNLNYQYSTEDEYLNNRIINNQNENTDKILNGWEQDKELDTSTTDEYSASEKEIMDSTAEGRESAISLFNTFNGSGIGDHIGKGVLAVSAIFKEFFQIDWLSDIISFSLTLGILAFVLGIGVIAVRAASEHSEAERHRPYDTSDWDSKDERWLM